MRTQGRIQDFQIKGTQKIKIVRAAHIPSAKREFPYTVEVQGPLIRALKAPEF